MTAMKVLLIGAGGQAGRALLQTQPEQVEIVAPPRAQFDLQFPEQCAAAIAAIQPRVVINAAAYTQVDKAETDAASARRVNAEAPGVLALATARLGARFIQLSTDFVFDGERGRAYEPAAATNPLNVYGASKLAGEQAVLQATEGRGVILRTAWLYASRGTNFVHTMLRLMASRTEITVVSDQVGTPTWATSLAHAAWTACLKPEVAGVLHWTDAGVASWYDFAVAIQEEALQRRLLERAIAIRPIATEEYPTPARRPRFSVLDKRLTVAQLQLPPAHWRVNLRAMFDELVR